ncbi:MAG: M23 family metallopeptidase [Acidobacteriaceae bacterium]
MRKHHYIVYVTRDDQGQLHKVTIPMRYAYAFVTAAVVGLFTITGLAGSYGRMLLKTEQFNRVRSEQQTLRKQYRLLQKDAKQKDIQVASLGSLASEVSVLYGLRQSKLGVVKAPRTTGATTSILADNDTYKNSLDRLYALRDTALSGVATRALTSGLGPNSTLTDWVNLASAPTLWPVMGRITSSFGERTDPFAGDEGEFHRGIDIAAPTGTAIHATGDAVVASAGWGTGYGREVVLNHGHGITTLYAHMASMTVAPGESITRGQVIGYVGVSGHSTGAHLHYEVRINDTAVNPHRYMRMTMAQMAETNEMPQQSGQ